MDIIPSILVQSESEFITQYNGLDSAVSMIQLDIADGKFVENTTWADPKIITDIVSIGVELHLMVEDPLEEMKRWENISQIKRVLVHYESVDDISETIKTLKISSWEIGIVLNPDTPISVIEPIKNDITLVMCMGVVPGKQGQSFIKSTLEKMKSIKKEYPNLLVSVDGAVNKETLPEIMHSGADIICPGSAIFGSGKPKENIGDMQELINRLTK
ncbi:MAG: hypothetical protein HOE80_01820 [Candidatus Magasanikbacteria bacterium]|jgi:ribulose-phosphate 3-epimerase|nr:hypothetical protein [Candidatus Magasanikbacteria bacterium]MBT4071440.1 hypothetical protein [Candidatus Magasanikbacteria bacterium]